ncbi:MAG: hypothetical protein WC662_00595 [Candidatus Paceibacterota bacterium]|jgi:hypothetical protein
MTTKKKYKPFTEEELTNIGELGEVLRKIHNRLLAEGIIKVKNGKTIWPKGIRSKIKKTPHKVKS